MMFPLMVAATSILVCALASTLATAVAPPRVVREIAPALKNQLVASAVLMAAALLPLTLVTLPRRFTGVFIFDAERECTNMRARRPPRRRTPPPRRRAQRRRRGAGACTCLQ